MNAFQPSHDQALLLHVALSDRERAVAAWRDLRPRLDLARLGPGYFALLPLAYKALADADLDEPVLPRLKGIYRSTWTKNSLLLERTRATYEALALSGVRAIVVGGAVAAERFYGDVGLRPTQTLELLVEARAEPIGAAVAGGEATVTPTQAFASMDATAEEIDLRGTKVRVLAPTEELLGTSRSARPNRYPVTQRVADAALVVRSGRVEWERVAQLAREREQTLALRDVLRSAAPFADVPSELLRDLDHQPVAPRQRVVHALLSGGIRGAGNLPLAVGEHLAATGHIRGLFESLRERWELEHRWQLPLAAGKRAYRILRGRSA